MAKPELTEWDTDLTASPEEEYAALVRAIRWTKGFGLLFVQCSPAEGERLMARVRDDIADKTLDVLRLDGEIDDLYDTVAALPEIDKTNVLFITGLEKSLAPYIKPGYGSEGDYYAKDTVPKILGKLNLQRERFRETLKLCFVFLVPLYATKYLIRRAADFYDWRSGVWEFLGPPQEAQQKAQQFIADNDYEQYVSLTPQQRRERFLVIEDLLESKHHSAESIGKLRREQGRLLYVDHDPQEALSYFEKALTAQPNCPEVLWSQGNALLALGQNEAAIACYDAALAINPNYHEALNNKGNALYALGQNEAAIACYDTALAINPNDHDALNNKGNALSDLGQRAAAIACYDDALVINPEDHDALNNKGNALSDLGQRAAAIACYDAALAIQPDYQYALFNKGNALSALGQKEAAIACYDAALAIQPDLHQVLCNKGLALADLGQSSAAIACYDAALAIQPDYHQALFNKGVALLALGQKEAAIACYDAALAIQPDLHQALFNKGVALQKLGRHEEAIIILLKALELKPNLRWGERLQRFILRRVVSLIKPVEQ